LSSAAKAGLVLIRPLEQEILLKAIGAAILLAIGNLPFNGPAFAQAKDKAPNADRPLLATFCDAADIKASACRRAKGYRSGKRCDVKLQPDRTSGKFLADGSTLLVVNYESGCEPHATNFGGVVIFEQKDGATLFKGYQPGFQANNCIILARNEKQDRLICITGHLGQGHLRSGKGHEPVMVSPETKCRNRRLEPSSRRPRQNTFRNIFSESLNPFAD
jgi:hypothetical protein